MPTLLDRINAFMKPPVPSASATTAEGSVTSSADASIAFYEKMKSDRDRAAIIKTCRKMYEGDPRVKKALRTYATDVVRSGYFVKTKDAQALEVAQALQKRLGLNKKLQDATRLTGRDGDSFYEVVVDENLDIVKLSRKPTLQMRRNSNSYDEFDNPQKAFWMTSENYMMAEPPRDAIWFSSWQIIHIRFEHDEEKRYGSPMWASATGAFKRVTEGEIDISVRRKVRAGMILHHVVEGSPSDVETYKEKNKAAEDNPFAAIRNYYTNKPGSISAIQGDAHLSEIADITHHIETMFTASDIPMELVAYGGDLNRDVLGEKKEEYDETLNDGREWLSEEFLKPLLELQWLLKGILPENIKYEIVWRKAKNLTPIMLRDLADGLMRLRVLGVKEELIQSLLATFVPGIDIDILGGDGMDSTAFANNLKGLSI
jgi:hypothetical protein